MFRFCQNVILINSLVMAGAFASTPQIPQVTTKKAAVEVLFDSLNYPARIESKVNATIVAESDGIVSKILSPLGSKVSRQGKILTVKHTDPVYQYVPMSLYSPVAGVVSQLIVTEGSSVTKGQVLAAVTDPTQIRILIEVAALDLVSLKPGLVGEFTANGNTAAKPITFAVVVKGVSPFVDSATGTATTELALKNKNNQLLPPGSVGQVSFKINDRKSFILPDYAISYKENQTYINVLRGEKAQRVNVTLGRKQRGQVEILTGIKTGDEVIERSSSFIAEGEKVQVAN
jgi:multidrug efflux pump subunit AcrA (membrane-fusion protein)